MTIESFREYLPLAEKNGFMRRVSTEVDRDWEIGAIIREIYEKVPQRNKYGVYFEKVKGSSFPFVVGIVGANSESVALALETTADGVKERLIHAFQNPIDPEIVEDGPCQENVLLGDEVDLYRFPFPIYSAGRDGGPYIVPGCVISKDPDTGERNSAVYRIQIKDKNKTTFGPGHIHHSYIHYMKQESRGKPLEVAICIGVDPAIWIVSPGAFDYGVDELSIVGGVRGKPVKLVKCKTIDLEVPATAEIIIEGTVPPNQRGPEGPWGEAAGYMEAVNPSRPVIDVKCITYRNNAVCHGYIAAKPPNEIENAGWMTNEALLFKKLTKDQGIKGILDLTKIRGVGLGHLVIKMKPMYPGHAKHVLNAAWTGDILSKFISVVDEDIDIRNTQEVLWAYSYRVQPHRDIQIVTDVPQNQDPSTGTHGWRMSTGSKMLIDATKKGDFPEVALPTEEFMEKVRNNWEKYGLPLVPLFETKEKEIEVLVKATG